MDASTWLKYKRSKVIANGFDNQKITFASSGGTVLDTHIGTQQNIFKKEAYQKCCPYDTGGLNGAVPLGRLGLVFRSGLNPRIKPRALTTNRVVLPITYTGAIRVDWGDGIIDSSESHTYASFGTYTVDVTGTITAFGPPFTSGWTGSNLLIEVTSLPNSLTSLAGAFSGAFNLISVPSTIPPVTDMSYMFAGASSFVQDISVWNVSSVLSALNMFMGSPNLSMMDFNGIPESVYRPSTMSLQMRFTESIPHPISLPLTFSTPIIVLWGDGSGNTFSSGPVSHTYDISGLYTIFITGSVTAFGSLSWSGVEHLVSVVSWIPSITNLKYAFMDTTSLTSVATPPSGVTDMAYMFATSTFNGNVSGWNVSSVKDMDSMFRNSSFTGQGLDTWDTSVCTNMINMFRNARIYTNGNSNIDLTSWNVSNVADAPDFFSIGGLNTTLSDPYSPFCYMELLFNTGVFATTLPLQWIGTIKVDFGDGIQLPYTTEIPGINSSTTNVKIYGKITGFSTPFSPWDSEQRLTAVSSWGAYTLTNLTRAFYDCTNLLIVPDLPANVTNTSYMFNNCPIDIDFSDWNTSNVTDMTEMFAFSGTTSGGFSGIGIESWNTSKVKSMAGMFEDAGFFTPLSLSDWDVSGVTDMSRMFYQAGLYEANGIDEWNTKSVKRVDNMFYRTISSYNSGNFITDLSDWNVSNVTSNTNFFSPANTDTTLLDSFSPYYIAPPTSVIATPYDASATVIWTAPTDTYNRITGYTVTSSSGPSISWTNGPLIVTFSGLNNGSSYSFTVNAKYGTIVGPGASSTSITLVGVPGAPIDVTAVAYDASASVTWIAPSDKGSPITEYNVTSNPGGKTAKWNNGDGPLRVTVSDLTNGVPYTFTVTAKNAEGTGPASTSNLVTPNVVPGRPTLVTATAYDSSASVTWTAPINRGSAITEYTVTSNPGGKTAKWTNGDLRATVFGLTNGLSYKFTVTATNLKGDSEPSDESNSVKPDLAPSAPIIGTAIAYDSSASVTWTAPIPNGGTTITKYTVTSTPDGKTAEWNTGGGPLIATVLGLTNGTEYRFTVTATNDNLTSLPSDPSGPVTPVGPPGAPTITSVNAGNATATVSWTAPANTGGSTITRYTVTSSDLLLTSQTTNGATSLLFTGLTNGTEYTFRVTATNANNLTSLPSGASGPVTPVGPPGKPSITSINAGNATATVSWTAPANTGGTAITKYTVTSTPDGKTAEWNTGGGPLIATVSGLTNGTEYKFRVTATNANNFTSEPSELSDPVTPVGPPDKPTITSVTSGLGFITVSWTAPANTGGSTINKYTVTSSDNKTAIWNLGDGALSANVTGLTSGTQYTFRVTATNANNFTSEPSELSGLITPLGVPGKPTITSVASGLGFITVSWTAPVNNGGSTITKYTVTSSGNQTATWNLGDGDLSANVTLLTLNNPYTFTVTATNNFGTGLPSDPSQSIRPDVIPNTPTLVTASPLNSSANVSWTYVALDEPPLSHFTVTSNPPTSNPLLTSQRTIGGESSLLFTGLTNGTAYRFTVTASNYNRTSPPSVPSDPVTPASAPGAPTLVTASPLNESATVSWTAPANNGGSSITGYTVTAINVSTQATISRTTTSSPYTFTGLTNGIEYKFRVTATNANNLTSEPSVLSDSVTPVGVAPGAPTSVTASPLNESATVSWTAPANTGGSSITGYTVTSIPPLPSQTTNGATSLQFPGLTNGNSYKFKVTATTVYGTSSLSDESNSVTPVGPPGAPTIGTAIAYDSSASITWTAPANTGGSSISGYTVTAINVSTQATISRQGSSPYIFTGLTNGTAYKFRVTATNANNLTSEPSQESNSVTPGPPLPAPMILQFDTIHSSVPVDLPISGGTNVLVDFGTGPQANFVTTLPQSGNKTIVKIHGSFTTFLKDGGWSGRNKLVSIDSWGDNPLLTNIRAMCDNSLVTSVPATLPSSVKSVHGMFANTQFNGDLSNWDVTNVSDMAGMFYNAPSFTGIGISLWNVSNVFDVSNMFNRANGMYDANGKLEVDLIGWQLPSLLYPPTDMIFCTDPNIGNQTLYDEKSPFYIGLNCSSISWGASEVSFSTNWEQKPWVGISYYLTIKDGNNNAELYSSTSSETSGYIWTGTPYNYDPTLISVTFKIELSIYIGNISIGVVQLTYEHFR